MSGKQLTLPRRGIIRFVAGPLLTLLIYSQGGATASSLKVLNAFAGSDGCNPTGNVILDGEGNLYSTTSGFNCDGGTVFELAPGGSESVLYSFPGGAKGFGPTGLVMDKKGNLYGTTEDGGDNTGCGVIFKLVPNGREKTLHEFSGSPGDGCLSQAAMMDKNGNLYGTTAYGGEYRGGVVFEVPRGGSEAVLHSFNLKDSGYSPVAGVIMDVGGNLFGANGHGGKHDAGTVFELASGGGLSVLYAFKGALGDGAIADGTLIRDDQGNFYGTLFEGGLAGCFADGGCGAVFKLAPDGTETILHFFTGKHGDGENPVGGLVADGAGNLYGTTEYGGGSGTCELYTNGGCGTVFRIAVDGTETILYSFSKNNGANGAFPVASLTADSSGNLYGTATEGGQYGLGTVFEITP